jgi:hypothetical protein
MILSMWRVSETLRARRSILRDSSTTVFLRIAVGRSGSLLEMPVASVNIVTHGTCVVVDEHDR